MLKTPSLTCVLKFASFEIQTFAVESSGQSSWSCGAGTFLISVNLKVVYSAFMFVLCFSNNLHSLTLPHAELVWPRSLLLSSIATDGVVVGELYYALPFFNLVENST